MRSMRVLFCIAVMVFAAGQLSAGIGPKHWFVSSTGVDPDCTLDKPCNAWQTAVTLASTGDEITALNSGDFGDIDMEAGHAVLIDAGGSDAGVLAGTVVIHIADNESAILRGLDLNGSSLPGTSVGITFSKGNNLVIEDCEIQNYGKRGISIESATTVANVFIGNTTVSGQANNGIVVVPPVSTKNSVVLDRVRLVGNGNAGIGVNPRSIVEIRDSVISNNFAQGVLTAGAPVSILNTTVSGNAIGLDANGGVIRISNVSVWGNTTGLAVASGGIINSFGNNQLTGNTTAGPSPTSIPLQ